MTAVLSFLLIIAGLEVHISVRRPVFLKNTEQGYPPPLPGKKKIKNTITE